VLENGRNLQIDGIDFVSDRSPFSKVFLGNDAKLSVEPAVK
jgi:hypothetical protein